MKKSTKRNLIEYSIILSVAGVLYFTGWHTEVIGFAQRGVLATGFMNPEVATDNGSVKNIAYHEADFSMKLVNADGQKFDMKTLRGKVIFLNIWASWCPPCLAEMPGINKLFKQVDRDKIAFVMLSVDDDFIKAIKLHKRKGYDFEIYRATNGIPPLYHAQSIPTTYVISADGKLVFTHVGMGDFDTKEFKAYLKSLE